MLVCVGNRTSSKSVWAYNDFGGLLWSYDTGGNTRDVDIDSSGNVYIVGTAADNSDGNGTRNIWKLSLDGDYVTGAYIDSNGFAWTVKVDSNYVYITHGAGADRLSHDLGSQAAILNTSGPVYGNVDSSGNIYLAGGGIPASLYKYNSSLVLQWIKDNNNSYYDVDFLSTGDAILGGNITQGANVRRFQADGSSAVTGEWGLSTSEGGNCRVAVDTDTDTIYAASWNGGTGLCAVDSAGNELWAIANSIYDVEKVIVASSGIVYAVGDDNGTHSGWTVNTSAQTLDNLIPNDCTTLWSIAYTPLTIIENTYRRKLVSIAGSEFWYESSAGTMAELTAANGDINTISPLMATEAYQKIFIVNKTNLKVADFINTKISTADAGANPTSPGMTLTGGTSSATMIVDYADAVTDDAAALIYGYRTSSSVFQSGETVTGTNSDGNAVSFVLDADEVAPPHWYDWTVFGNDTTNYGTIPTSSTLVALYRGRLVLNDVLRPHAWYMSKVGNPFKFLYDFDNDADLSAVAYSNAQVGEVGDIITAFIPYKDDLFIFGCASSIWILIGDPLAEGQLSQITDGTGVWGSRAWCMDNNKNLYFLGVDGIYQMAISETSAPPTNISKQKLPNLMSDLDLDQESHRVVLSFDPDEQGILISKTALSDGTNTNYFYSLITGGYFQETYPDSCGIFSAYYYPATNDTYKKFLVGCTDGYIREFDGSTKNDATTSSTSAISSYATTIFMLGQDEDHVGMLRELRAVVAGGASGGDFSDSDGLSFELHKANDAETVLEDIKDGATAFTSGSWSTTGKQNKTRPRMRGSWAGLKLYNSTASETWAVEKIIANIEPKGGIE